MIQASASTEIDAPPAAVWAALTDLPRFAEWNPFIRNASGTPAVGARLLVRVQSSLPFRLVFRPTVLAYEKEHVLRWRGYFGARWLARGDHMFTIAPTDDGRVRFEQREVFGGLLPRIARRMLERETRRGFTAMNRALKERAERAERAQPAPSRASD
jgi:hypothetical protein